MSPPGFSDESGAKSNASRSNILTPDDKLMLDAYDLPNRRDLVLSSPDTYIGSLEVQMGECWVYDKQISSIVRRQLPYAPGLYKILDQILLLLTVGNKAGGITSLKVNIDPASNTFCVDCAGSSISTKLDKKGIPVPQVLFTRFSHNNEFTGMFTSIFSKKLEFKTSDGHQIFKQKIYDNMSRLKKPKSKDCKASEKWTKVTVSPDLQMFGMSHLEGNIIPIMHKRVVDLACTLGDKVKVHFNDDLIPPLSFINYVELYIGAETADAEAENEYPRVHGKLGQWDVCLTISEGEFTQVSFVNGIATLKGGTHVDYIAEQIIGFLMSNMKIKGKQIRIKREKIKSCLWLFVNTAISNPVFDSHSKETVTNNKETYGCDLSDGFFQKVPTSGIIDKLISMCDIHDSGMRSKHLNIVEKLEDATNAGTAHSEMCTLILTEGDSAKSLAMTGQNILGRDLYGVFPIMGKFVNVAKAASNVAKAASKDKVKQNEVVRSIVKIMGLKYDQEYKSAKGLRYGHIMIMTDQDHDGSHIKGLLINLFYTFWPSLLKVPGFLQQFVTPIMKVTRREDNSSSLFYSIHDYESWKDKMEGNVSDWSVKYYKGLASHTYEEGKMYFQEMGNHTKNFEWAGEDDGESIKIAFGKEMGQSRKRWLNKEFKYVCHIDSNQQTMSYQDFMNNDMRLYALAHLQRTVPSMIDGLKPVQRKILFSFLDKAKIDDIKVSDLSGYVSHNSAYLHGDQNLSPAIIKMARQFVGSNNLNLLHPIGHFGTRDMGGKDAASGRYISTELSPIARTIFPKEDEVHLTFLEWIGKTIEPRWYAPIIPMVLVNGCKGVGTGWSTEVPKYNTREVVRRLRNHINQCDIDSSAMLPWYRGFKGKVTQVKNNPTAFNITGVIKRTSDTTLRITELPIGLSFKAYKVLLQSMLRSNKTEEDNEKGRTKTISIEKISDEGDEEHVNIHITLTQSNMNMAEKQGLDVAFKLIQTISITNMHLFDSTGKLQQYSSPLLIIKDFYTFRLPLYQKRKAAAVKNFKTQIRKLKNQIKLISGILDETYSLHNMDTPDQISFLKENKFDAIQEGANSGYDYLLSMPVNMFTSKSVSGLISEKKELRAGYDAIKDKEPSELWLADLDKFEEELAVVDEIYEKRRTEAMEKKSAKATFKRVHKRTADGVKVHAPVTDVDDKIAAERSLSRKRSEEKSQEKKLKKQSDLQIGRSALMGTEDSSSS